VGGLFYGESGSRGGSSREGLGERESYRDRLSEGGGDRSLGDGDRLMGDRLRLRYLLLPPGVLRGGDRDLS
jgi:hypothetical protein